jgi:hypothetical protein
MGVVAGDPHSSAQSQLDQACGTDTKLPFGLSLKPCASPNPPPSATPPSASPGTAGLVLDTEKTLPVACVATQKNMVSSQPTTITAIQVESVTRIPT